MTKKNPVEKKADRLAKNLPDAIKKQKGFLLWRAEPSRKVPYYIDGGRRSGTQGEEKDLRRLATFDGALSAFRSGSYSGIGLAMLPGSGLIGLDFDDCLENRQIKPDLAPLVEGTYCEVSPSGNGVRAFFYGEMPDRKNHTAGVEVFCQKAYLTLTGDRLNACDVIEMPEGVRKQLDSLFTKQRERTPAPGAPGSGLEGKRRTKLNR